MDRELDKTVARFMGWTWDENSAYGPGGGAYARRHGQTPMQDPWWWLLYYSETEESFRVLAKLKELYSNVVIHGANG